MTTTSIKTAIFLFAWVISVKDWWGVTASVVFIFYIFNMIYFKVIRTYFNGSWIAYFKSIFKRFLTELKKLWPFQR